MRKDVSRDGDVQVQEIRKKWLEKTFQEVDFKHSEKIMRKDVSAGGDFQVQNIRTNDEKRCFKRLRDPSSRIPKKYDKRRFRR